MTLMMTLSLLKRQSPYTDDSPSQECTHWDYYMLNIIRDFLSTNNYALIINGRKKKVPMVGNDRRQLEVLIAIISKHLWSGILLKYYCFIRRNSLIPCEELPPPAELLPPLVITPDPPMLDPPVMPKREP